MPGASEYWSHCTSRPAIGVERRLVNAAPETPAKPPISKTTGDAVGDGAGVEEQPESSIRVMRDAAPRRRRITLLRLRDGDDGR